MNWYNIKTENTLNIAEQRKYRDVYILDEIGGFGVWARDFIKELNQVDADTLNVHVDSPGGSITDGVAIYNALRGWSGSKEGRSVDVYIEGIAASIASIVILAGDKIKIAENASVYTHLPMLSSLEMPNKLELLEGIETLEKFENVLANIYMKHTGASEETVRGWMQSESWFFGQEAVDAGFADEVVDRVAVAAKYNVENYNFKEKHPATFNAEQTQPTQQESTMEDNQQAPEVEEVEVAEDTVVASEEVAPVEPEQLEEVETEEAEEVEQVEDLEEEELIEEEEVLAVADEKLRAEAIVELAKKYENAGDLNAKALEAIVDGLTVDEFKDRVLEIVASRAATTKVSKLGAATNELQSLRDSLKTIKDPVEKAKVARKIRDLR